jgi:hypothetical protein
LCDIITLLPVPVTVPAKIARWQLRQLLVAMTAEVLDSPEPAKAASTMRLRSITSETTPDR